METEIEFGELSVSARVFDSIVRIAAEKVEGVACVGVPSDAGSLLTSFFSVGDSRPLPSVGVRNGEDGLEVAVRLTAFFGYPFLALADSVRSSVATSVEGLVGVDVSSVDVFIDALVFPKE